VGLWVGMCVHLASKAKAWAWVALGGQQRGGIRGEAWSGRHPRKMGGGQSMGSHMPLLSLS
jgi:hypothetical protein